MLNIGSHVGMRGKEMMLGSVKEALSYGANTFMLYTGAPQNTRRKNISELRIEEAHSLMKENGMEQFVVHAPYIINLANTIKKETFQIAVEFLAIELERTEKMGSNTLILHPGAHVGAGLEAGISKITEGLNEVLEKDSSVMIALETMAGKGSETGRCLEELAMIYDRVRHPERLRICFDTCHVWDSGYDIVNKFDAVIERLDQLIGKEQIAVFHINDSKNPLGAGKDRHENIGFGAIGFPALNTIVHHPDFTKVPKILETPYIPSIDEEKVSYSPYGYEIKMLREQRFQPELKDRIRAEKGPFQ